ncbi:Uncharacterised protein [Salmonella enterica subsp. enterica serovar Gallinarum]|nr:Uncharacterised protein [Salmonella enterica subsp. enterica serovar Gallinarum]
MDINGFIAVGLYGLFQAGANGVQCFLPANAFKFAFAAAAVRIPNGKDTPPAASASEPSAADFTNVLRLTPVCCFSPGITHSIVVIISLYIDNYNKIINMLMM